MDIALYRPEIPPNTGNIARLSMCTGSRLHIIGEPSFSLDAAAVRRAGIDYWDQVRLARHAEWSQFVASLGGAARIEPDPAANTQPADPPNILLFTRFADAPYSDHAYEGNEALVFGRETSGLPEHVLDYARGSSRCRLLRIPVVDTCRSLNLSNAVAVVVYEALRQRGFPGLAVQPPAKS